MRSIRFLARFWHRAETLSAGHAAIRVIALVVLAAAALGVRGAYWLEIRDDPCYLHPRDDVDVMLMYNESCRLSNTFRSLAGLPPFDYRLPPTVAPGSLWRAEGYFRNTTPGAFIRPPGYTVFVALVFMFFHETPQALFLVQMTMGLATLALVFLFARRLFNFWPAWVATFCLGVNWTSVYYENVLHAPVLTSLLLMLLLNCIARMADNPRNLWFAAVGAALGAVCVSATTMLLFSPLLGAWTAWVLWGHERRRQPAAPPRALLWPWARRTVGQGMLMAAAMVLVMSPITISNSVASGRFYLLSQGFWFHLAVGNFPGNEGSHVSAEETRAYGEWGTEIVRTIRAEPGAMRLEDAIAMAEKAVAPVIARDPMRFAKLCVLRVFWFWRPWEYAGAYAETPDRMVSGVLAKLPWWFGWVVSCGAAGVVLLLCDLLARLRRERRNELLEVRTALQWLPVMVIPVWMFPHIISFMTTSHRMPIVPLVFVFLGFAAVEVPRRLLARRWASPCLGLACAAIVAAVSLRVPEPPNDGLFPEYRIAMDLKSGDFARAWRKMDHFVRQNRVADKPERAVLNLCTARADFAGAVTFYSFAADHSTDCGVHAALMKESIAQFPATADKPLEQPRGNDMPERWLGYGLALLSRCDEPGATSALERAASHSQGRFSGALATLLLRALRGDTGSEQCDSGFGPDKRACLDTVLEGVVDRLEQCGNAAKAAAVLQEMGTCSPRAGEWLVRRARLLQRVGDDRAAVAAYTEALEKGAPDPVVNELNDLMEARIPKGDRAALWQEAVRRNPQRVQLYLHLGRALDAGDRKGEALEAYRNAFRLDSKHPACRLYLAQSLAASGALDEAVALAEQTVPLPDYMRPELAETYAAAGRYCISRDDWTRAVSLFEKAVSVTPDSLWHKCWLAEALLNLGRTTEAKALVDGVIAADPANSFARALQGRMGEKTAPGGTP